MGSDAEIEALKQRIRALEAAAAERAFAEQRYRTLVEHAPEAIVVLDVESNRLVDANENAARMLKRQRAELLETELDQLHPEFQPDGRRSSEAAREWVEQAVGGEAPLFEWTHLDSEGNLVPCEVRLVRLASKDRVLVRGSMTDISDRKRLEEQLRQSQKMEAVGQLAGGIAHDFNNLLVAIIGHCDLLERKAASNASVLPNVEAIRDAADRAASLTRQMLAFSRKQMLQPRAVDLNTVVADTSRLLARLIGEHIELRCEPAPEPVVVKVDPGQVQQALMNLATNARDAMPSGGRLVIAVVPNASGEDDDGEVAHRYAALRVSDTGRGMDEEILPRIYEPFFTTKGVGEGTGLGLSMVYGFVKQSGGDIEVESAPGAGATFTLSLPLADSPIADRLSDRPQPTKPGLRHGTVLVVEDAPAVAALVERVLTAEGYDVHVATDGAAALDAAKRLGDQRLDLLFTDVVMPKVGGVELARRLREERPGLKVLFTSGYPDEALRDARGIGRGRELLEKPYSPEALLERIANLLEER